MSSHSEDQPTAADVVDSMERMSGGVFPGDRRSSARGACYLASFRPSGEAVGLTIAPHLQVLPVAATVRFSNSEGSPHARDDAPVTRGMAVRFHLPDGTDTDLIGITVPRFVASTPHEFLGLTEALRPDAATGKPDLANVQTYAAAHPHLVEAIMQQPPIPTSYGTAAYWAIHAFIWVNATGVRQAVRYRWEPEAGRLNLLTGDGSTRAEDYLTGELHDRLKRGPVVFKLQVQLAEDGDPTDDPTVAWPENRKEVTAGRLEVTAPVGDQPFWAGQRFDPTRVTAGIELSDDPVLAFRAHAYAESFARRCRGE